MRDKHYKSRNIRLEDGVYEILKQLRKDSGKSWNLFIRDIVYGLYYQDYRHYILQRDNFTCQKCGEKGKIVHHIIPKCKGGIEEYNNLITLCEKCHKQEHKNRTYKSNEEFLEYTSQFRAPDFWKKVFIK